MNSQVFIVTSGVYEDYHIDAVFSSEELAEKYCKVCNEASKYGFYEVEEHQLDSWDVEEVARTYYTCYVYVDTGEMRSEYSSGCVERPEVQYVDHPLPDKPHGGNYDGKGRKYVMGNSYISEEHAQEIADERRTRILTEKDRGIRDEEFNVKINPMTWAELKEEYGYVKVEGGRT